MENIQLKLLCKTPIMNKLLGTLWFKDQVRVEGQGRDIYLTTHIIIPQLG